MFLSFGGPMETEYARGFRQGYPRGWCYESNKVDNVSYTTNYCELTVFVPTCPFKRFNDSWNSFRDGYDRGFAEGMEAVRNSKNI
jgi:hypothetical protein